VCLAFFFSFSYLAPMAARSFDGSGDMPCCRSKGKCCCRSHRGSNANGGPIISAAACLDCGNTLGGVSATGLKTVQLQILTPAIQVAGHVPGAIFVPQSHVSVYSLRQRPPPSRPIA
jgi:hypothetical protein